MIYDYLITNKFTASYESDVMLANLELLNLMRLKDASKKFFKLKVISLEQMVLSIPCFSESKMQEICNLVSLNLKKNIMDSLPFKPGACSVFLIHSDQWSFLVITKEDRGGLKGVYNKPYGDNIEWLRHSSTGCQYDISLNIPKIFAELGLHVKNIDLKVRDITRADSGAVTMNHLISSIFDPKGFLCDKFSSEDLANLRTLNAFVPCIIGKLSDKDKIQDAHNLFLNFVNSQIDVSIIEDLLRDLYNRFHYFDLTKDALDLFKEATSHVDMLKNKDVYNKIDQLLIIIHNQIKQDIKKYQKKKTSSHIKSNLIKQKSEQCAIKDLEKKIKKAFSEDYSAAELLEYILCRDGLGFKIYIKDKEKEEIINNLSQLASYSTKQRPLATILEVEEESDFGPWEQNSQDIGLSGLNLVDDGCKLSSS